MCEGMARPRDRGLEESQIVALGYDQRITCIRIVLILIYIV